MKGLRNRVLLYIDQNPGSTVSDLSANLESTLPGKPLSTQTATDSLRDFLDCGLVSISNRPEYSPGFRGRVPYVLTPRGKHILAFMKFLSDNDLISDEKELSLTSGTPEKDKFLAAIGEAGFNPQDFETALAAKLISRGAKIMVPRLRYRRGVEGSFVVTCLLVLFALTVAWLLKAPSQLSEQQIIMAAVGAIAAVALASLVLLSFRSATEHYHVN